jgi:hypothetical protein
LFFISTLLLFCAQGTKQDGIAMDVGWFETYHGLNNLGKNILKFIGQHVIMDEICEHFGRHSSKNGWKYDKKFNEVVKQMKAFY